MSKTGANTTPVKQENNQFKKEIIAPKNNTPKDDKSSLKRQSDSFITPGNRNQAQHGHGSHQNQNRDRSDNQNDSHQYNKHSQDTKNADKEEKSSADQSSTTAGDKKFTGRCRLFVGNLTPDVSEDDFRKMFEPYGEISEVYVNTGRGFGFVRLDYRHNAEAAKAGLDGLHKKGRILRVRFASHGAALKVKNLHPFVTNELLEQSFSQFGDLERCVVIVDDRGRPTSEGIVEFVRKPGANSALRRITEGVFLMGAEPKPIAVEPLEQKDEEDGMPEKFLTKTDQYKKEREKEPRFAPPGTFEYEFGMRWKQLEEVEKQRIEQIKKDTEDSRLKLEDEMQNALYEYQAEQIRQDLRRQQDELLRLEELRNQDRLRRQQEHEIRRQQDDRDRAQQDERRRADTMMMMRQQELARGRVPMDIGGLRGRDDMLMSDRYGDRMPDRMGERMPDRMGERMPDRMGERMPDRMGERMPDRMGERMPDRMGERMPDRMGERMPDRMGERMPDRMGDRMSDRMGDRMPDRMGDRMPDRMGDRMPDRMGERMPDRMGDRMPDRMGERMPDRMGDRMPDRMGPGQQDRMGPGQQDRMGPGQQDRMGPGQQDRIGPGQQDRMGPGQQDRMGPGQQDRMGPGQQGFTWDEKQRAEANLRGEAGRGRGSGAPPLQPPPVPPTAVNTADTGAANAASAAPATATTATATQGTKTSPKPLMQAGAFGSAGNTAGTGPTPNATAVPAAAAGDANTMRRPRFEQGGPDNYQNQRGVLGAPPSGIGGLGVIGGPGNVGGRPGPLGSNVPPALVGNALRGGPQGLGVAGIGPGPNLFQAPVSINERILMERRREAARDELLDIKRMRRY